MRPAIKQKTIHFQCVKLILIKDNNSNLQMIYCIFRNYLELHFNSFAFTVRNMHFTLKAINLVFLRLSSSQKVLMFTLDIFSHKNIYIHMLIIKRYDLNLAAFCISG